MDVADQFSSYLSLTDYVVRDFVNSAQRRVYDVVYLIYYGVVTLTTAEFGGNRQSRVMLIQSSADRGSRKSTDA